LYQSKNIGREGFKRNKIKTLKLPNLIEEIERSAFENNNIEELDLSSCSNLKNIEIDAFQNNKN